MSGTKWWVKLIRLLSREPCRHSSLVVVISLVCLGIVLVVTAFSRSPPQSPRVNSSDPHAQVVLAYREILGREPDPPGLKSYVASVAAGHLTIEQMRTALEKSDEHQEILNARHRADAALRKVCGRGSIVKSSTADLAEIVANVHQVGTCAVKRNGLSVHAEWEKHGLILAPAHFYVPLPKTQDLEKFDCRSSSRLTGIQMNDEGQLRLLNEVLVRQKDKFVFAMEEEAVSSATYKYQWENCCFGGAEAHVYWSLIVEFRPKRILEIGAGWSTKLAASAVRYLTNLRDGKQVPLLESIDPYATGSFDGTVLIRNQMQDLAHAFPGFSSLRKKRIQDVEPAKFQELESGDILFIDSSHSVFVGSDVTHLVLEVLPLLRPGVFVHFHDIFIPFSYSCEHIADRTFWNEQYLLQAFLVQNSEWEVIWGEAYMETKFPEEHARMKPVGFSGYHRKSSFWMRRVKQT